MHCDEDSSFVGTSGHHNYRSRNTHLRDDQEAGLRGAIGDDTNKKAIYDAPMV